MAPAKTEAVPDHIEPRPTMLRETDIDLGDLSLRMIEMGPANAPAMLFLHGWPQCSHAFEAVMQAMSDEFRVAALDLPGIGRSRGAPVGADKRSLARYVDAAIEAAGLTDLTLVGHDIGGMIVYAYIRAFPGTIERAAILDAAVPGIDPWSHRSRDPRSWPFGFQAIPDLPESLISGREAAYFESFYNAAAKPAAITDDARRLYAQAYASPESLKAGLDWHRAFAQDERDNIASAGPDVSIPVLYLRGEFCNGGSGLEIYLDGFRRAGLDRIEGATIPGSGHYSPEEQPDALAAILRSFALAGAYDGFHSPDLSARRVISKRPIHHPNG